MAEVKFAQDATDKQTTDSAAGPAGESALKAIAHLQKVAETLAADAAKLDDAAVADKTPEVAVEEEKSSRKGRLAFLALSALAQVSPSVWAKAAVVGALGAGIAGSAYLGMRDGAHNLRAERLAAERTFAADASHQLRTPLTALLMRLEEISSTENLDVVAEESHIAIAQVERLSSVVDDLLARSRSGADRPPSVSLDSVLAALQREWQPTYAVRRRAIHITGARGLRVLGAPGPLSQIFSTLLENSLAHGAGTVTVEARRSGPSVIVEVHDEGAGIDPALAPHIFERSVSSRGSGLGLGLARDLASAQGGRLELVSASGAEFALFLSGAAD